MNQRTINDLIHIQQQKLAFYSVFNNKNPFGRMFNNADDQKIILCPIDGYCLNQKQFNALLVVIKTIGEISFYVTEIEGDCFFENANTMEYDRLGHWEFDNKISYEEYTNMPIIFENALYSKNGTWGIIISHENHAVISGSNDFIELFKDLYSGWIQDFKNFIEMWKYNKNHYNSNLSWLPDFLEYINSKNLHEN